MIKRINVWVMIFFLAFVSLAMAGEETERVEKSSQILSRVMQGENGVAPRHLLAHARGVILIPGIKKIGFIAGIKRGKGVIVLRNKKGQWLPPAFVTLSGGSFGFQAGAKESDVILLLMTDRAVQKFMGNKIKLGVDLGVAAGPVGKEIGLSQEDIFRVDAFSYVYERGLFAGAIISGSVLSQDEKANRNFYGENITLRDLLKGKIPKHIPQAAQDLISLLNTYSSQ